MPPAMHRSIDTREVVRATGPGAPSSFEAYRSHRTTMPVSLTATLILVARRWRATIDEHLRPIGQSAARMEALATIMASSGPCSQVDVANRLRIEGPTVTRMIDVLSRDGLVERRPSPSDRRTKHLVLTSAGYTVLEEIFGIVDGLRAQLLAELDEADIAQLRATLLGLLGRLDAGLVGAPVDDPPEQPADVDRTRERA